MFLISGHVGSNLYLAPSLSLPSVVQVTRMDLTKITRPLLISQCMTTASNHDHDLPTLGSVPYLWYSLSYN